MRSRTLPSRIMLLLLVGTFLGWQMTLCIISRQSKPFLSRSWPDIRWGFALYCFWISMSDFMGCTLYLITPSSPSARKLRAMIVRCDDREMILRDPSELGASITSWSWVMMTGLSRSGTDHVLHSLASRQ